MIRERLRPDQKSQKISEDMLVLKNRGASFATGALVDTRVGTGTGFWRESEGGRCRVEDGEDSEPRRGESRTK